MAEKVRLFEAEIKLDDAIAETQKLKAEVDALREKTAKLKKEEGETSKAYIEANASLKAKTNELRQNERITQQVIIANKANEGSIEQLKAQLALTTAQWNKLSEEERKNTDTGKALSKQKKDLTEQITKEEKSTGDARRQVGFYERAWTGVISTIGFATGIIASVGVGIKLVTGIINSAQSASDGFSREIEGIKTAWLAVGKAIASWDFKGFIDNINIAAQAGRDYASALDDLGDRTRALTVRESQLTIQIEKYKQVSDNVLLTDKERIDAAKNVAKLEEDIYKDREKNATLRFEAEVKRLTALTGLNKEQLLTFIETYDRTEAARKQAEAYNRVVQTSTKNAVQLSREINLPLEQAQSLITDAKSIVDATDDATRQYAAVLKGIGKTTDEELDAVVKAWTDVDKAAADYYRKTKENNNKLNALLKKDTEQQAKLIEAQFDAIDFDSIIEQTTEKELIEINKRNAEFKKMQDDFFNSVNQSALDSLDEYLQNEYDKRLLNYETQQALAEENLFTQLDFEREALELKRQQEIEFAEKIGADVSAINEKYDRAEIELERAKQQAKLELAADFFGNIATIFGEQTSIGKAAAIAETTVNTYKAATGAYASLASIPYVGPVLGIDAAGAAVAAGLANVKKITAVKSGLPGEKNIGGSGVSAASAPQSVSASIGQGIVARSNEANATNQLNALNSNLANQSAQPVLVVDSVTAAQRTQSNTDVINSI